jgi:RNA polymerase sigma factor (sigma-70 family)
MLNEALDLLNPRERELFYMRAVMGLSTDEIASQTGIAKPSIIAMVSAARKKVFTELTKRMKQ